ncbi:MAG: AAA family ATPase [Candidatus Verstraetearchaeota archaeon]|nr:AAA family ATPase [Candidatus Verstraetearchaeota archaeon]
MLDRIPTGIPKLDEIIGGGFIKGRTYLIAGETGTGKTIMSLQFLLQGLKNGEQCAFVSFDDRIANVISGTLNLGWNFNPYIRSGQFVPFEIRLRTEDLRHGKESKAFVKNIQRYLRGRTISRLVLDPISALAQGVGDLLWVREYIREIVSHLEEEIGCTTVVTCDIPTGSNSLSRYGVEEFISSGIIVLEIKRIGEKFYRLIYVRKMRWSPMDMTIYTFEIVPGKGIVIGEPLNKLLEK